MKVFQQNIKPIVQFTKRRSAIFRSCFFALWVAADSSFASFDLMPASARYAALAGAGVGWRSGADAIYVNPAALHGAPSFDVHFFYAKPYDLQDLNVGNVAGRHRRRRYSCGIGIQYFGNELYHENQFLAALAIELSPALLIGLASRYGLVTIQRYGQADSFLLDIGLVVRLGEKAAFGFSAANVTNAKVGVEREPLPSCLTVGMHMTPLRHCVIDFDLHKDIRFPLDVRCGISCMIFSVLTLRTGVGSAPSRLCAGFTLSLARFRIEYALSTHVELGLTHLFSLGIF
ncbi:hypothetical protein JW998_11830 [candidate division KSB1 bacterium]|nr:hypothetical protein [candidate division KSB1 bacterium]